MTDWRLAHSLEKLRAQVNLARPNRSKSSDGSIGDANHASRSSDHNPWIIDGSMGVVSAIDITHDPEGGVDSYKLAEVFRAKKDKRIKYVISNRKIFSSVSAPWVWRPYSGINPHNHHVHVSVQSAKSLYDAVTEWDLGDMFEGVPPEIPARTEHTVLRRGSQGKEVVVLQTYLKIEADGYFGPKTEAEVTQFQSARGLSPDGVVGAYTWAELEKQATQPGPIDNPLQTNIICTMFGGSGDPNKSAYDGHTITDAELGCALPFKFPGKRPKVRATNVANGKSVLVDIVDVGPWNTTDNYWTLPAGRPQAETGRDTRGRKTNMAGIDLTPAADKAIELGGLGRVNWEFVVTPSGG